MPVYNIPSSSIPTSPSPCNPPESAPAPEKDLDQICGNRLDYVYSITAFRPGISKVVRTKSIDRYGLIPYKKSKDSFKYAEKLSQSVSRTRRLVLEYALCNEWKWFVTLTIDRQKEDRTNLAQYYKHFKDWCNYQREKTGKKLAYLLVPEKHKKDGWHLHGMFNSDWDDLLVSFAELDQAGFRMPSGKRLPSGLIRNGYYDCPAYRKRFGFCSFGVIRDPFHCAFYVSKYITKSLALNSEFLGKRSFYPSQGLNKAVSLGHVYVQTAALDAVISRHYDFCSTGWYRYEPEMGYDPLVDLIESRGEFTEPQNLRTFDIFGVGDDLYLPISFDVESYAPEIQADVDAYFEATQLAIKGF